MLRFFSFFSLFFFNDTATTEIYTLSLHDALPILGFPQEAAGGTGAAQGRCVRPGQGVYRICRSEEHTSELQSQSNLVCRLLLEKKKQNRDADHRTQRARTPTGRHHPLHHASMLTV